LTGWLIGWQMNWRVAQQAKQNKLPVHQAAI
jgi:hypothetical protein